MFKTIKKCLFVSLILFLFFISNVEAIVCEYPDIDLNITYNEDNSFQLDYKNIDVNAGYSNWLLFKYGQSAYTTDEISLNQELFKKNGDYVCPDKMYVCEYYHSSVNLPSLKSAGYTILNVFSGKFNKEAYAFLTINEKILYIIDGEQYKDLNLSRYEGGYWHNSIDETELTQRENFKDSCGTEWYCDVLGGVSGIGVAAFDSVIDTLIGEGVELISYKESSCNLVDYNGQYTPISIYCAQLTQQIYQDKGYINDYKNCGNDRVCMAKAIKNIEKTEEGIKEYCSKILQTYNYVEGQSGCIDDCLTIKDTLNSNKEGTNLYDNGIAMGKCNFSSRLLAWGFNIMKWLKYILPVIVIILSILEFIKVIGSGKDDEMKKVQGRFIRRLIAAALIFIVPLIIEFALDKFGFGEYIDGCDIITEFE